MKRPTLTQLTVFSVVVLALAFAGATVAPAGVASDSGAADTLANLQAAYNGESNAHARYLAFAAKADEEGYGAVASLFRAAARAEEVHAANHAKVIQKMGGDPTADVKEPEVKSTRENLQAAVAGESYERDTMYPEFLARARSEGNRDALQTFNYAKSAETEHARLYQEALASLDSLSGSSAATYYVCSVCGYTTTTLDFSKCPSCYEPKDNYRQVS